MTVSTIASLAAGIGRTLGNQNAKLASSVSTLVSKSGNNGGSGVDLSALSAGASLQSQIASLRTATQNVAQASALVRVAQGGTTDVSEALGRLEALSKRASSGSLTAQERSALDVEFQSLRQQINRIASSTQFNGQKLLDGSLTSESLQITAEGEEGFAIANLSADALLGDVNVLTASGAEAALQKIRDAQTTVKAQQETLGALSDGLEFAFASIETATQNQDAARAVLGENDFDLDGAISLQQQLQEQSVKALLAQTSKLPGNILGLISE
jgi:flagellin